MNSAAKFRRSSKFALIFGTFLFFTCACSHVSVDVRQDLGVPTFAPTNPQSVEILRIFPARPSIQIAAISVEPTGNPPIAEIELKLRDAAAKLGANAAVIVADRTVLMGASVSGGFAMRQVTRDYERLIDAVAIRYTE